MRSNLKEKGLGITRDAIAASDGAKREYTHVHIGPHWEEHGHQTKGVVIRLDSALVWPHLE